MLETEIKKLTAAVEALNGRLDNIQKSIDYENQTEAHPELDQEEAARKAAAEKEARKSAKKVTPQDTKKARQGKGKDEPALSFEDTKVRLMDAWKSVGGEKIKAIMSQYGTTVLSEIEPMHYADMVAKAEKLVEAQDG